MRNKLKNKFKRQTAITLVALVVTVVILLILAGVSINLVLGENGIIKKAGDARDKTKIADIEEKISLALGTATIQGLGSVDLTTLNSELTKIGYTGEAITSLPATIEIDGNNYTINGNGTVANVKWYYDEDGKITDGTTTFEVGDYVNYQNPTSVSITGEGYTSTGYTSPASKTGMSTDNGYEADLNQTFSLTNNGKQVNWRILGISEDGQHLLLTTGSPLQKDYNTSADLSDTNNPYYWLYGAEGYINSIDELDKICAIYKNDLAEEVRSLTIEDINRLCNVTVDVAGKQVTNSEGTNIDQGGNIGLTYSYPTSTLPTQYETPEDFLLGNAKTYVEGDTSNNFSKTSDAYYYLGSDAISSASPLHDVLFSHTGQDDGDYRYYWLASRAVLVGSGCCGFDVDGVGEGFAGAGWNLFSSDGGEYGGILAVRPVVSLKSEVTGADIQKIEVPATGEEEWNYSW